MHKPGRLRYTVRDGGTIRIDRPCTIRVQIRCNPKHGQPKAELLCEPSTTPSVVHTSTAVPA